MKKKTTILTNFFRESEQKLNEMVSHDFALLSAVVPTKSGKFSSKMNNFFISWRAENVEKFGVFSIF